jgi:PTS system nitrogen regulatory IIA component
MITLSDYLDPSQIKFFEAESQDEAIVSLIDLLCDANKIIDRDAFHQAILDREKIVSTGVGMGVAIPHAKLPSYDDFFVAVGLLGSNGVDWKALDGAPVRLVFLVGGPDDKQTQYLQILSIITLAVKDEERRKAILQMPSPEDVFNVFLNM